MMIEALIFTDFYENSIFRVTERQFFPDLA